MNREIKFRGQIRYNSKKYKKGEWYYGNYRIGRNDRSFIEENYEEVEVIPKTIGQYTGLHDKNGTEIYEGDIVRQVSYKYGNDEFGHKGFYETISKVVYKGRAFQYGWIKTDEIEMLENFNESFIEIIGNIYENKELLEA